MGQKKSKDFEKIYLRYLDFDKINNLPKERTNVEHLMGDHYITLKTIPGQFYCTHKSLLSAIGFQYEDILSICRVHLYKYLVLFSIKNNPDKAKDFIKAYRRTHGPNSYPTETDFTKKDASIFISYLKQKLSDLLACCEARIKNITGKDNVKMVFELPHFVDKFITDVEIYQNPEAYGARKLSKKEVLELKKNGANLSLGHFIFNDRTYRSIKIINTTPHEEINNGKIYYESYEAIHDQVTESERDEFINESVRVFLSKLKSKRNRKRALEILSIISDIYNTQHYFEQLERLVDGE